jgi:integrase
VVDALERFGTNVSVPPVTLAEARAKRDEARKLLAQEIDPKDHREEQLRAQTAAHGNTLKNIAAQWLEIKKANVSADHATDTWRSLELHIFPTLGMIPIHKINAVKTIEIINPIAAKGSLETVKRLCQRLNEVMTYAVNAGIIEANPLSGIAKAFKSPQKEHMPTLTPQELPLLMKALTTASIKITTRCLIEWQLHTMVRPSEAAGATWEEMDLEQQLWKIPAERMKKKRPHTVPLSNQCMELLSVMSRLRSDSPFVFPADRDNRRHTNAATANVALKRMGFHNKLVAHGLRSIASTTLNEQGFDGDIIESALAHAGNNEVRNAYNRADYLKRRTPMMQWWSDHIEQAATGNMSLTGTRLLKVVAS